MSAVETPSAATSEGEGQQQARRRLSADGQWWWNGRRWVPAITEDGLWKWDGARWNQTVQLEGKRPEDLAPRWRCSGRTATPRPVACWQARSRSGGPTVRC